MTNRDYTKEVGIASPKKTWPRPVAYGILALVGVGMSLGVAGVMSHARDFHQAEKLNAGPAAPAAVKAPAPAK